MNRTDQNALTAINREIETHTRELEHIIQMRFRVPSLADIKTALKADTKINLLDQQGQLTEYYVKVGKIPNSIRLKSKKKTISELIVEADFASCYYNQQVDGEKALDRTVLTNIENTISTDIGQIKQRLCDDRKRICMDKPLEACCKSHPEKGTMDIAMYTMQGSHVYGPRYILNEYILTFKI